MKSPFHDARLKVKRAQIHIDDLHSKAADFAILNPYQLSVEFDRDAGCDAIKIAPPVELPRYLLTILGDAIHNLRSALDIAWFNMVYVTSDWTRFPIHETLERFEKTIPALKENTSAETMNFLVNILEPYKGGKGDALYSLHRLDIEDKHRLLIAYAAYGVVRGIECVDGTGEIFSIPDWIIMPLTATRHSCTGRTNVKITNNGQAELRVTFGKDLPCKGKPVIPTLTQFVKFVNAVIDTLELIFLAGTE